MNEPTYRIDDADFSAPIADWLLLLLAHSKTPLSELRFTTEITFADLQRRLTVIRGGDQRAQRAGYFAHALHANPLDISFLLGRLCSFTAIAATDPTFPWTATPVDAIGGDLDVFALPWRLREGLRLTNGPYKAVPWVATLAPIADHFVHLSLEHEGFVSFTETPAKGEADIQTPMKPARYLKRFYPDLADHVARDLASALEKRVEVKFAVTADDIENIYLTGPGSCMSKVQSDFEGHCHPVRVYGDSDLQLAYITDSAGQPIARTLVWPEQKRFSRIYGHEALLRQQLERDGYTQGSLAGARIRRIDEDTGRVVMPYIDNAGSFGVVDDNWLIIGGPLCATMTDGIAHLIAMRACARCEDDVSADDMILVDDERWCEHCADHHSFASDLTGDRFSEDAEREVVVDRRKHTCIYASWAEHERDEDAFFCDATGEWYAQSSFHPVSRDDGEVWVDWYAAEHGGAVGNTDPGSSAPPAAEAVSVAA